jgi:6-pyruvoyltetrahydropterin/6-carboxytetrahydropterin synthase
MKNPSSIVRITKIFHFEMAHALYGYDGPCKNIHGHSYQLSVTIKGKVESESRNPKLGMVVDFSVLKDIVDRLIVKELDHALVLNEYSPHKKMLNENSMFEKIVLTKFQPTCENLLIDFAMIIRKNLPKKIKLHHLKLRETPTSYAEWHADDNK